MPQIGEKPQVACLNSNETGQVRWHVPVDGRPVDLDDYMAERRSGEKPISLTTLRSDSNAIAMFCAYTSSPT